MLVLGRFALRHGLDLRINRLGRMALVPVMGALFFAMAGLHTLGVVLLYIGIVLALLATARYVQTGLAQLREREQRRPLDARSRGARRHLSDDTIGTLRHDRLARRCAPAWYLGTYPERLKTRVQRPIGYSTCLALGSGEDEMGVA